MVSIQAYQKWLNMSWILQQKCNIWPEGPQGVHVHLSIEGELLIEETLMIFQDQLPSLMKNWPNLIPPQEYDKE